MDFGLSQKIAELKAKAVDFNAAYAYLMRSKPDQQKEPVRYQQWLRLKNYGDNTKSAIQRITSTIDTAGNVAQSLYYGLTHPFGYNIGLNGRNELGVVPIVIGAGAAITISVIAASIAAIGYFVANAYEYGKFANAPPEVKAQLIARDKAQQQTGIGAVLGSVKGILIVGAIIFIAPKIISMMRK